MSRLHGLVVMLAPVLLMMLAPVLLVGLVFSLGIYLDCPLPRLEEPPMQLHCLISAVEGQCFALVCKGFEGGRTVLGLRPFEEVMREVMDQKIGTDTNYFNSVCLHFHYMTTAPTPPLKIPGLRRRF